MCILRIPLIHGRLYHCWDEMKPWLARHPRPASENVRKTRMISFLAWDWVSLTLMCAPS